ncbi:hypothetical protein PS624_00425 [Pseudomonas fluorescens]|uniref:Uncharacterized protein n=1 Tax=Pseudomonas fluorescens TaxID=294 RepID=A0A5E6PLB5_PSEFL|nr:hypothetical protein PS624_00425 [Pseudomonas fluorescens]
MKATSFLEIHWMRLATLLTDFAYETARLVRYPAGEQCEIMRAQSSQGNGCQ